MKWLTMTHHLILIGENSRLESGVDNTAVSIPNQAKRLSSFGDEPSLVKDGQVQLLKSAGVGDELRTR